MNDVVCMNLENIIVVPKLSRLEYDMHRHGLTEEEAVVRYRKRGEDAERILGSHRRQKKALAVLEKFLNKEQFVPRERLTKEIAGNAELIVAFGGDDNFKAVSHYADDTPVMGINSDPETSEGALTYFVAGGFESVAKNLREGKYKVEEWTRLEAEIDGNPATPATSEYFLGESKRTKMSKHILEFGGKKEKQGCSGLLVSTGAGSTGWYSSAHRCRLGGSVTFPRTVDYAKFVATEPYMGRLYRYSMLEGVLKKGDELVVQSLNDNCGILESDSVDAFEFNREARAAIRISDKPLRVVNMKT